MNRLSSCLVAALLTTTALASHANRALAEKNSCLACHATATKMVGPSYQDVAVKYAGQPDASATLVKSIRNGSTGKWGDQAMPAHPKLSEADAKKLVAWILGGAK